MPSPVPAGRTGAVPAGRSKFFRSMLISDAVYPRLQMLPASITRKSDEIARNLSNCRELARQI
jgi:hypothetical protein